MTEGLPRAAAGRFCEQRLARAPGVKGPGAGAYVCGGELRHARRVEGNLIVTYLRCLFCGRLTRMLEYNMETGAHLDVSPAGEGAEHGRAV